jgi:4-amino-4-deoxy-L-arabinose transferase-like glycosyltransferase
MTRRHQALAGGAVVAALASILLAHFGARQAINYDSIWHVLIARQGGTVFWQEVYKNAHPPLFYLLLKGAIGVFGNSLLVYRAWSILAVAFSTVLIAHLVVRVTRNAPLAILACAAFALTANGLEIGLEVRSYAVFLAWALVALSAYLDWLSARPGRVPPRTRALFAAALSGAILTHYSAFFILAATLGAPFVLFALHPRWRRVLSLEVRRHRRALAAMFGAPVAVGVAALVLHVRHQPHGYSHVAEFLFDPHAESRAAFVLRSTRSLALLFLPELRIHEAAATVLAILLVGGLIALMAARPVRGRRAVVPFVLLVVMAVTNLVAALAGRYPYGGYMRHEIFLFPFALLSLFVGIEQLRRVAPRCLSWHGLWAGATGLAVAVSAWVSVSTFPVLSAPFGRLEWDRFRTHLGAPQVVLADQYSSIFVFGQVLDGDWRVRWQKTGPTELWQVWDLSRSGERFVFCRSEYWQFDLSKPGFYGQVGACLARADADRLTVFRPQLGALPWNKEATFALAQQLSAAAGLELGSLFVHGNGDIEASFQRRRGADAPISILAATLGANCRAAPGNATEFVRASCEGRTGCGLWLADARLGDPAPGCAKDFEVRWRCGSEPGERRAALDAEPEPARVLALACTR